MLNRIMAILLGLGVILNVSAASAEQKIINLLAGSVGGTYARFAQDIANVIYDPDEIRVMPILGRGSKQNVRDLLLMSNPEIHVAIVQNDVLNSMRQGGEFENIDNKINYLAKLYNEEIHFVTNRDVASLKDLDGGVISVDRAGSGTEMTALVIFDALDMDVTVENLTYAESLEALENGVIDAMIAVVGKPAAFVREIPPDRGFRFVPIELTKELEERYFEAVFTAADYPFLVPQGQTVPTIAVGAVLASYNFTSGRKRERLDLFTNEFFSLIEEFRTGPYHEKWKEVDIRQPVPGWQRYEGAARWLQSN